MLGLNERIGSIEAGMRADVAVFAGDPLNPATAVRAVVVGGRIVHEDTEARPVADSPLVADVKPIVPPASGEYAIKTTRGLTPAGVFEPMTIVVRGGRIASVDGAAPEGVEVFDLGAAVVTPGLVATHGDLGLGRDVDETSEADAGNIRAIDAFHPALPAVGKLREGGVLATLLSPGLSNVLSGCCAAVGLGPKSDVLAAETAEQIVLSAASRSAQRFPGSLIGQIEMAENALRGQFIESNLFLPEPILEEYLAQRRVHLSALADGGRTAFIVAADRAEIAAALQLIEAHRLRAVLVGPEFIRPHLDDIKRLGVAIVARPARSGDYGRYLDELVAASRAGVPVTYGDAPAEAMRRTAALAVGRGMPADAALRGLTGDGARVIGVEDQTGSIRAGRRADLVIWTGSPLDLRARVAQAIVGGESQE
jgi:imidazolonepropionase-like amidohydrolase